MKSIRAAIFVLLLLGVVVLVAFPELRKLFLDWLKKLLERLRESLREKLKQLAAALLGQDWGSFGNLGIGGDGKGTQVVGGKGGTGQGEGGSSSPAPAKPGATGGGGVGGVKLPCDAHGGVAWTLVERGGKAEWMNAQTWDGDGKPLGYYACNDGYNTYTGQYMHPQADPCLSRGKGQSVKALGNGRYQCRDGSVESA